MKKISRAIISVTDKTGVVELAKGLAELGIEIISTGGTGRTLQEAGLKVIPISAYTNSPEMLDGRLKTLHPKIHGGILSIRDNPAHAKEMAEYDIPPIDMVVVNLYAFEKTVAGGATIAFSTSGYPLSDTVRTRTKSQPFTETPAAARWPTRASSTARPYLTIISPTSTPPSP